MTLANLLAIQRLLAFSATPQGVQRLLTAAARNLPGHHQTALQALPLTMGLPNSVIIVLDALRKQRNLNDYEGDPMSDSVVSECLVQAETLLAHTHQFLQTQFACLLIKPNKS